MRPSISEESIPRRFAEQVRAYGSRLAIESDDASFTFLALNQAANRLAHGILSRRGLRTEPIALLFEHGAAIIVAMLAVLKSGKCCVVLDARTPADRLKYLLAHSQSALIVTDRDHLALAGVLAVDGVDVLTLSDAEASSDEDPGVDISPDDLAIIIYTSGSTGQPKGVMHTHRNMLGDVGHVTSALHISEHDRWIWHTAVGFAGSARTIFGALLTGSALYPFDTRRHGFTDLAAWLTRYEITIFRSVPTTFRGFMATLSEDLVFPAVRVLSMGGEPLFRADVDAFNRHFLPHAVLIHPFGPTECMLVCWNVIPHGRLIAENKVPIGYPLADTIVRLLDDNRLPVNDGEIGEIAVQSPFLSPGYWRDDDQTNAVFVRDDRGVRFYLTGDLGMRSDNGCLTHVGRRDFQVKIRGYRIEVSEIEAALRGVDGIGDAVVIGRPNASGEMRLIAYVVPITSQVPTVAQLRAALVRSLPDYMMPSAFVAMASLPQTPTGKTDRLRLPAVDDRRPEIATPFVPPRTPVEEALLEIWKKALGITWLGVQDNLLEVGGDSLIAMRIIAQIRTTLNVELSLADLFDAATVAATAMTITHRSSDAT